MSLDRAVLALRGITKRFGRVTALDAANLVVQRGTVHTLLGENGAGKTTLMRVAYGMIRPDAGSVEIEGRPRRLTSSADAIRAGVGMVHQHFALVPAMTVAENVALGGHGRYDARASAQRVRSLAANTGLNVDPAAIVADLSVEAQQRVEIIKAVARQARILILDEPTAVLAPAAAATLLAWLRRFADDGGAVVLITHKLREALEVADAVTVLRRGHTVVASDAGAVTEAELAGAMLGSAVDADAAVGARPAPRPNMHTARFPGATESPIIVASHVTIVDSRGITKIADASFEVRAGEIVGIAAVEGAGQHELLRALAGRRAIASGQLTTPASVGFIPEDRQRDGLVLDFTLYENMALRGAGSRRGGMAWEAIRARTGRLMATYDVRGESDAVRAATLSGGNQQKLILAREVGEAWWGEGSLASTSPSPTTAADGTKWRARQGLAPTSCLVAENPTRGLDVQATAAVHARLREARDRGMAIVVHASGIDEVLALADRVLVVAGGVVRETAAVRETVGRAMLGLALDE